MSWFWWLLWAAVSAFILGVFVWTTRALFEQKAAWKIFAANKKLKYTPGRMMQSAVVSGTLEGYNFYLASEERETADIRGRKYVTMLQFKLKSRMPVAGIVGSGDYRAFALSLSARDKITPELPEWDDSQAVIFTDDRFQLEGYFTPERLKVFDTLVKQKNVHVLFMFDTRDTYLRLETIDPMLKVDQLEKLTAKIIPMVKVLELEATTSPS